MRRLSHRTVPLALALAVSVGTSMADEVRFHDGSALTGQLVTVILQDTTGQVHVVPRDRILIATTSAQPVAIQPPTSGGWGARGPAPNRAGYASTPGRPQFEIELSYEAAVTSPEISAWNDPGEQGEVFLYKPIQAKNRAAWIRVGSVRRDQNEVVGHFSAEEECELLKQLVYSTEKTREEIIAEVAARKTYTHRMHYTMSTDMNFRPGTWTVYLNFPKLRRHKIWANEVFNPNRSQKLSYAWAIHSTFGK